MTTNSSITRSRELDLVGLQFDGLPATLDVAQHHDNPANPSASIIAEGYGGTSFRLKKSTYGSSDIDIAREAIQKVAARQGQGAWSEVGVVFDDRSGSKQKTDFRKLGPILFGVTRELDASGEPMKGISQISAVSIGKIGLSRTLGVSARAIPKRTTY